MSYWVANYLMVMGPASEIETFESVAVDLRAATPLDELTAVDADTGSAEMTNVPGGGRLVARTGSVTAGKRAYNFWTKYMPPRVWLLDVLYRVPGVRVWWLYFRPDEGSPWGELHRDSHPGITETLIDEQPAEALHPVLEAFEAALKERGLSFPEHTIEPIEVTNTVDADLSVIDHIEPFA